MLGGCKRRQQSNCADSERCVMSHFGSPPSLLSGCSTLTTISSNRMRWFTR
jgi:hypothetical protein